MLSLTILYFATLLDSAHFLAASSDLKVFARLKRSLPRFLVFGLLWLMLMVYLIKKSYIKVTLKGLQNFCYILDFFLLFSKFISKVNNPF